VLHNSGLLEHVSSNNLRVLRKKVIQCTLVSLSAHSRLVTSTSENNKRGPYMQWKTHFVHTNVQCAWRCSDSNIVGSRQCTWHRFDTDYCCTDWCLQQVIWH